MENNLILKQGESLDDLQISGYKIIQSDNHFKFSIDAVLLSHFPATKKNDIVMDMCSGTGIVGLLLCAHTDVSHVDSLEIQQELSQMCSRSIKYNNLENKMNSICMDLKDAPKELGYEKYDLILCNPPYQKVNSGKQNQNISKTIARFEVKSDLDSIIFNASKLLKNRGRFTMSHRPERLSEIFADLKKYNLEPKKMQLVQSRQDSDAVIVLVEAVKNANVGLKVLPTLIVYEGDDYTDDIYKIYDMNKI